MKNIHILPTDKPSRVFVTKDEGLGFDNQMLENTELDCQNQHIYITSDEEIKERDWYLDKFNQKWKLEDKKLIAFDSQGIKRFSTDNILGHECKKIILTTDQDLIKDGVREIDNEFLEWFVNNPSCESVLVTNLYGDFNPIEYFYEIIIPQEKQTKCYCGHTTTCDCGPETLEEVRKVERSDLYNKIHSIVRQIPREDVETDAMDASSCAYDIEQLFYKLAQERSYSEEDMKESWYNGMKSDNGFFGSFNEWFNKFKKK